MNKIQNKIFDEERALYAVKDMLVENCTFDGPADGESALKECSGITVRDSKFNLRYPFWHNENLKIFNTVLTENCRAALWYDSVVAVNNSKLFGIKAFRECKNISIGECDINSPEFLWKCSSITVKNSKMVSEYPFFECENADIDNLTMTGKYSFQYVKNINIKNSNFQTKDAFWHSENVTVSDSVLSGEYLGWYSKNLTLVRCKIIGTQPLCYCENLILEDCIMENTDLSFERSDVNAKIIGNILSVKNPKSGKIVCQRIEELILEEEFINPSDTLILTE